MTPDEARALQAAERAHCDASRWLRTASQEDRIVAAAEAYVETKRALRRAEVPDRPGHPPSAQPTGDEPSLM